MCLLLAAYKIVCTGSIAPKAQKKSVVCVGQQKSKNRSAAVAGALVRPAAADRF